MTADDYLEVPDGVRLFFRLLGDGDGSLIVPGVGGEIDFGRLSATRRVAFYDVRNRGRSDPVAESVAVGLPVEVEDIDAIRARVGFERPSVLGWSYVGVVAALYAARYPERVHRLVMVCPGPPSESLQGEPVAPDPIALQRLSELAARGLAETDPVAFAREWRRIAISARMTDPAAFDVLQSDPSVWPNEWPAHLTDALGRVFASYPPDFDYRSEATRIAAPTLVVHGALDTIPLRASEEWVRAIPDARLLVLPTVGHYPHAEAPLAFFDAVETFLGGAWPDRAERVTG